MISIQGVQSVPRTGFLESQQCVSAVATAFGIGVRHVYGAWWEKGIENSFEDMIEAGLEVAVTFDYDAMFTADDFGMMLGAFEEYKNIDALSCVQPKRGGGLPMIGFKEQVTDGKYKATEPLRVNTAHFGLTFIRLSKLRDVPKPWFRNIAGDDGRWRGPNAIDADVYFWQQWAAAGRNVYILPCVSIGHLEVVCAKIDLKDGTCRYRYPHEWNKDNAECLQIER